MARVVNRKDYNRILEAWCMWQGGLSSMLTLGCRGSLVEWRAFFESDS